MFKKILIGLALLIAIFCGYVAMQPSDYRIERSMVMSADPEKIFEQVNSLRNFDKWSPWAKLDPNSTMEFGGADAGEGATATWAGNSDVGKGKMTITESQPHERVRMKLDFEKPMEGIATVEFLLKPDGDGTRVTWAIFGRDSFIGKAFCVFMDREKIVSDMYDKGLTNLKKIVESS